MNEGENMSRNRFARRFAVSMVAVASLLAVFLMRCSTSTAAPPATDTGFQAAKLSGDAGAACAPSSNPNNPVICIASDGTANPPSLAMHNNDHGAGNPIIWRADGGGALALNLTCPQIDPPSCNGPICIGRTNPQSSGTCTYTASVNGVAGSDPIIVTDNCCPSPFPMPRPRS